MSNIFLKLHCPNCGKNISDSDNLCPHCGVNLDEPLEKAELDILAQQCLDIAKKTLESGNNLKDALVNCDQAIEYVPELADAYNLRGLILGAMGKTADSILSYQQAVDLNPDFTDAKANLAEAKANDRNNQGQDTDRFTDPRKNNMTKGKAIALAAFTAWPFLYIIVVMGISILVVPFSSSNNNFYGNLRPDEMSTFFRVFIPIHIATLLEMLAVLIYYIIHLTNTAIVPANKKVLWAVILLLGNPLFLPIYWYLYIWKPLRVETYAGLRAK
jgi:tetratricopeptide (TPR) repeat protein